jgi:hypothetical protein
MFKEAWLSTGRRIWTLHGELGFFGPAAVLGFPCCMGDDTAFAAGKQQLPYDPNRWIPRLAKRYRPLTRVLWLMHEPPSGTILSAPGSVVAGSDESTTTILNFCPLMTISGHDHQTPRQTSRWFDRVGSSLCINVGQTDSGPLHFVSVRGTGTGESGVRCDLMWANEKLTSASDSLSVLRNKFAP